MCEVNFSDNQSLESILKLQMSKISDSKLLQLWKDPHFEGSFRGAKAFQTILKTNLNINVSERRLRNLFLTDKLYLIHQKRRSTDRRKYDLNFIGELLQADLAYMFDYEGFKYFLLVVDCFSSKLFVEPLKDKSSASVTKAFKKIFSQFGTKIYKIESDRGSEFKGSTKVLFKKQNIFFKRKFGQHKANFAERYIYYVKRKLFLILRSQLSENWPKFIRDVVNGYNNTPLKKLGFLTPNDIKSEKESVDVQVNKNLQNIETYRQPNLAKQNENKEQYETKKNKLQIGDYCYKFFDEKVFDKKYNISVRSKRIPTS